MNGVHGTHHKNKLGLRLRRGNFLSGRWWKFADGHIAFPESLAPMFVKQFHEGTHSGRQLLRQTWFSIFMSPSSPVSPRQYVKGAVYVPKTIPDKDQKCHPRYKVLEELLLKT
jgi:hypothetical protein